MTSAVLRLLGALGQINTWGPLLPFPVHFLSLYSSVPSTTLSLKARTLGPNVNHYHIFRYCVHCIHVWSFDAYHLRYGCVVKQTYFIINPLPLAREGRGGREGRA